MKRILAAAALLLSAAVSHNALAACASTVTVKDGAGASKTFCAPTDGGANLISGMNLLNAAGAVIGVSGSPLVVDGSAVTQPVSATSLPLPTGAATSAKQPALGTAGTPSTDVLTVQGKAGMTAFDVNLATVAGSTAANGQFVSIGPIGSATAVDQNNGLPSAGTQRTTIASMNKKRLSALSTTVTTIKASAAGQLRVWHCYNPNASAAYLQVFDVSTSAGVTLGTTAPDLSFAIPPTNSDGETIVGGYQFSNGIQVAATTTATGSTAPGTALDCNAGYN